MKWLKRVSLPLLACLFLLSSPTHAQNEGYSVIFSPESSTEKLKKLDGRKFQAVDKTSDLKSVKPKETVTVELNMDGVGKPIKRTKILSTLREEIDVQKQKKSQDKIEIAILLRYDVDISKEEFMKKYDDLFEGSFIDIEGHKLSFLAKLNVEQIEKLAMLDEVSYISKSDDSLDLYGEVEARKITPLLNESTDFTGIKKARNDYGVDGNRDGNPTSYSKNDVVIAIIDTGIDGNHIDLNGGKVIGWKDLADPNSTTPYDDMLHGTHVASIAAGTGDGAQWMEGVAPGAALVGVKVCYPDIRCPKRYVLEAMDWLIDNKDNLGVDIINLSLGGIGNEDPEFCEKVESAREHGILTVVAAGNMPSGAEYGSLNYLAKCSNVISVGNMADPLKGGWYLNPTSNRGTGIQGPSLTAPGTNIKAALANSINEYTTLTGTSMSSPFVAGLAALMLDASNGSLSYHFETEGFGKPGYDKVYGHGLILGHETVKKAAGATWGFYDDERDHISADSNISSYNIQFYDIKVDNLGSFFASTLVIHDENGEDLDLYIWPPGTMPIQNGYLRTDLAVGSSTGLLPQETISLNPSGIGVYTIGVLAYDTASYSIDWSGQISVP